MTIKSMEIALRPLEAINIILQSEIKIFIGVVLKKKAGGS